MLNPEALKPAGRFIPGSRYFCYSLFFSISSRRFFTSVKARSRSSASLRRNRASSSSFTGAVIGSGEGYGPFHPARCHLFSPVALNQFRWPHPPPPPPNPDLPPPHCEPPPGAVYRPGCAYPVQKPNLRPVMGPIPLGPVLSPNGISVTSILVPRLSPGRPPIRVALFPGAPASWGSRAWSNGDREACWQEKR